MSQTATNPISPAAASDEEDPLWLRAARLVFGGVVVWQAGFVCFMIFKLEEIFGGFFGGKNVPAFARLVFASHHELEALAVVAALAAIWTLIKKRGRKVTRALAALFLFLFVEIGALLLAATMVAFSLGPL